MSLSLKSEHWEPLMYTHFCHMSNWLCFLYSHQNYESDKEERSLTHVFMKKMTILWLSHSAQANHVPDIKYKLESLTLSFKTEMVDNLKNTTPNNSGSLRKKDLVLLSAYIIENIHYPHCSLWRWLNGFGWPSHR